MEILLASADGLDWETLCRVDALHFLVKSGMRDRRGVVCTEWGRLICQRSLSVQGMIPGKRIIFSGLSPASLPMDIRLPEVRNSVCTRAAPTCSCGANHQGHGLRG
jgi:hypothetical protein